MLFMANNLRLMSSKFPKNFIRFTCNFSNILPMNLRGPIIWIPLPASPLDPSVIASYRCSQSKEKYLLEHIDDKFVIVRSADRSKVYTLSDDKIPGCWRLLGVNKNGKISKPGTP